MHVCVFEQVLLLQYNLVTSENTTEIKRLCNGFYKQNAYYIFFNLVV